MSIKDQQKPSFFEELRRRKVIRVGATYLVGAWLLLQIADVLLDPLRAPPWLMTALIIVVALGFPFVLALSWAFDWNAGRVQRDEGPVATQQKSIPAQDVASRADERSVAVLPFVDISPDRDNEHFTDGLTEELLNALRRVPGLRIASRTSCFAFKGKDVDATEVAEKLRVNHLVEGSVRKSGEKLRVAVQLIETSSDSHLWSECYDESMADIFSMQEDISRKICNALQVTLHARDTPDPTTDNPQAYDFYLRGLGFFTTKGSVDLDFAIDMFTQATKADPRFTKAWMQLTVSQALRAIYHGKTESVAHAGAAAQALLELAPGAAETHSAYGMALLAAEKYDQAMLEFQHAIAIDPKHFDAYNNYARTAFHKGDLKTALAMFEKAAACDPDSWETVLLSIQLYEKFENRAGALEASREGVKRAERFLQIYPDNQRAYYLGAFALQNLGDDKKARSWMDKALEIAPGDTATKYNAGCFYAKAGDPDKAFECLQGSITSRSWVENDPSLDPLRDDPRYEALLKTLA